MMDIHRCRFVPYPASAINSLAFSHSTSTASPQHSPLTLRLAIGRANGDVEIWNPLSGAWIQESILRGGKGRSIEGLVWTHDLPEQESDEGKLRLFSIGCSTVVTEWDLTLGQPIRHSGGNHGEIWCIAAQPRWQESKQLDPNQRQDQIIAVGCADGSVVLHSTAANDLTFSRILARSSEKKSRVLCLAFRNRRQLVVGYANSIIKVFDIATGAVVGTMSCTVGRAKGQPSEILVWSIKCLPDGDVVSGDSSGEVKIWDGKTWTMKQRMHSHLADVLDLCVSKDGLRIMSGSMDRRTAMHQKGKNARWNEVSHRKFHTHDVKTMASYESRDLNIVVSGGPDATPIVIPFRHFGRENPRALSAFAQASPVLSAPPARLLLSWWEREIQMWRFPEERDSAESPKRLVAKIMIQGDENLSSVSLSRKGDMIAVATISGVKLFSLQQVKNMAYQVRKVNSTTLAEAGAKLVQFSPDGNWLLVVRSNNSTHLYHIARVGGEIDIKEPIELLRQSRQLKSKSQNAKGFGSHGPYGRTITRVAWSSDSRIIATSDVDGWIDSWGAKLDSEVEPSIDENESENVSKNERKNDSESEDESQTDSQARPNWMGKTWIRNSSAAIPRAQSMPLVLSFRPTKDFHLRNGMSNGEEVAFTEDRLVMVTSQQEIFEYRALKGGLSDWARRNPPSTLPPGFKVLRDRAMGCLWDTHGQKERLWIYGLAWIWMLDLSKDFDGRDHSTRNTATPRLDDRLMKRKRPLTNLEQKELMKNTSGAGNRRPNFELDTGIGRKMRFSIGDDVKAEISLEGHEGDSQPTDEEEDHPTIDALTKHRRQPQTTNEGSSSSKMERTKEELEPASWSTYKYRPILGIVGLDTSNMHAGLEVAIVERPSWELDLPPRWEGDQE